MTCILLVFQFVRNLGTFLFMKKEQPFSEKRKRQKKSPDQQAYVLACRPCPFYDLFTLPRRF